MKNIISVINENKLFFILYACFFFFCFPFILFFPREHFLILLNSVNNSFFDNFFKYSTFLGDGLFILIIIFLMAFLRIRFAFLTAISYIISGLIVQIIKHIVRSPRPLSYLSDTVNFHFVSGIEIYYHNSFPSGHSATAFAFFLLLALISKNKKLSVIYFVLAMLVGLSRIYLLQHFLIDVWAGSFIGVVTTLLFYSIFENSKVIMNSNWMNFSVYYKLRNK